MPPDSRTKIRPQQSCLRCRERKVKCDRSIPCHACIIRGIESECTYLTTAEDRKHISQAEVIDRLRREVAQLRTQLSQGPRPRPHPRALSAERGKSRDRTPYVRQSGYATSGKGSGSGSGSDGVGGAVGYAVAGAGAGISAGADMREGSWDGSSPSSSIMTHSMSINSPDSTGSGTASQTQSVHPGSTIGTNIAEDMTTTTSAAFIGATHCQGGLSAFAPGEIPASIPMQNIQPQASVIPGMPASQMYRGGSPYAVENWGNAPYRQDYAPRKVPAPAPHTSTFGVYEPQSYHQHNPQWGQGHQFAPVHPHPDSVYSSSSIGAFAHANTDPLNVHSSQQPSPSLNSQKFPSPESLSQHPLFAMPSSWTGKGKQELLETLLETIGSCDEAQVAQVVQVIRTSATPEEAVSGICQVLGIGGGR
ncbi:hypothetical protein N7486_004712 [Penicillium sp. IBT 16267x]|nr:hypothetical protein N7486_004712 [Penicillium sp. IBT 16267x]